MRGTYEMSGMYVRQDLGYLRRPFSCSHLLQERSQDYETLSQERHEERSFKFVIEKLTDDVFEI